MIFAVVDDGVVVGTLAADTAPSLNIPRGRTFVDITHGPQVQGGEQYDAQAKIFTFPATLASTRLTALERDVAALKLPKV